MTKNQIKRIEFRLVLGASFRWKPYLYCFKPKLWNGFEASWLGVYIQVSY